MKRMVAAFLALALLAGLVSCRQAVKPTVTPSAPSSSSIPSSSETPSSSEQSSSEGSSETESSSSSENSEVIPSSPETESSTPNNSEPEPPVQTEPEPTTYNYQKLTDIQKVYYKSMLKAAENMQPGWITLGEATADFRSDIAVVRNALSLDNPQIFWLPSYYATATASAQGEKQVAVMYFSRSPEEDPSYLVTRSEKETMQSKLSDAIDSICAKVTATDPYEIELQLHDLLCEQVTYTAFSESNDPMIYTAYGALVNGRAVCEGYSRAMQLLLSRFSIKSVLVTGVAGNEGHMWNAVQLDGKWYHLDVTWDDTQAEYISHEYFNLDDALIKIDHTINKNYYELTKAELAGGEKSFNIEAPVCDGIQDYYFNRSGFVFAPEGEADFAKHIVKKGSAVIEAVFSDYNFKESFGADDQNYIAKINRILWEKHTAYNFRIAKYYISEKVLTLIMESKS